MKRPKLTPRIIVLNLARDEELSLEEVPQHRPDPNRPLLRIEICTDQLSRKDACELLEHFATRLHDADPEWIGRWPRTSSRLHRRVHPARAALHAEHGVVQLADVRRSRGTQPRGGA